jgi:hypothetical protein
MPASEVTTPPASSMSKATSAVYLKPSENQPKERAPSKPQHQQVTRLSHNTGMRAAFKPRLRHLPENNLSSNVVLYRGDC